MHKFEIEIKSLLGSAAKADELIARMKIKDPDLKFLGSHKQLNHYFMGGNLKSLYDQVQNVLDDPARAKLQDLTQRVLDFSVRTRDANGKIILAVKAAVDDTTSENGTARLEWEAVVPGQRGIYNIDNLDKLILSAGFQYQAKWSRERQEFVFHSAVVGDSSNPPLPGEINVSIDKNAGYGCLAEFEMVIDDESKAAAAKAHIRTVMHQLGVSELPQDRLQRMFNYYNQNWREYYGTDKVFTVE